MAVVLSLGAGGSALAAVQYPAEGGTWEYGKKGVGIAFSYYTVDKSHGSSITRNGNVQAKSIKTAAGKKSIAEKQGAAWTGYRYHYRLY
ncbi:hypothetical protein DD236_09640 [Ancrocorticia populi]|uniref:Lactococcin 972 family bacteriocin n=2 Tax=Ancrocorticia populi TaxID=2175228 RepID=A0A2V1K862_9ACTO|nr:hypothetical protein DD236_09640 [Ancrocorticia populi]